MIKILFFDLRDVEVANGFTRQFESVRKSERGPLLLSEDSSEGDVLSMYGSVVRRPTDGLWQMWYTTWHSREKTGSLLAYAESDDGVAWRRPKLDAVKIHNRKSNIVFDQQPHGITVFYDEREPREAWRYKMLGGAAPSGRICAFRSADGIHWAATPKNPVIGTNPDCPMSLLRMSDGRFAAYHRIAFGDRRVGRSESWDFANWSEAKIVMEPGPGDPAQLQFYGLGSSLYGAYELGILWCYHTDADDFDFYKMRGHQQPELAYCRSGYAWHRAEAGSPLIARGTKNAWDWSLIQPACAPVYLKDEVRYYYVGSRAVHGQSRVPYAGRGVRCGIGYASVRPDRFVGLASGSRHATLVSRAFWTDTPRFFINANVSRGGHAGVQLLELDGKPVKGFELDRCEPIVGDSLNHEVHWKRSPDRSKLVGREIRVKLVASRATIYSISSGTEGEAARYWDFRVPSYVRMDREKASM